MAKGDHQTPGESDQEDQVTGGSIVRGPSPGRFTIYSSGFEIATFDPQQRSWMLRVDGERVSLNSIQEALEHLKERLEEIRPSD